MIYKLWVIMARIRYFFCGRYSRVSRCTLSLNVIIRKIIFLPNLKFLKLSRFQTKKLSPLHKAKICWSVTILIVDSAMFFQFKYATAFSLKSSSDPSQGKHCQIGTGNISYTHLLSLTQYFFNFHDVRSDINF